MNPTKNIARLFLFLALALPVFAATWPSNGTRADTQAQIDLAADGDTVTLPAGSFTWTGGISISGKGIHLQGAGSGRVVARSTSPVLVATSFPTSKTFTLITETLPVMEAKKSAITPGTTLKIYQTGGSYVAGVYSSDPWMRGTVTSYDSGTGILVMSITSSNSTGTYARWIITTEATTTVTNDAGATTLMAITEDATNNVEISGIRFQQSSAAEKYISITGSGKPVLLHDCYMQVTGGSMAGIFVNNNRGIVWNCSFVNNYFLLTPIILQVVAEGLTTSWTSASTFGMNDTLGTSNFYTEDSDFHAWLNISDFSSNCRAVLRYCLINNAGIGSHGPDSGTSKGARHWEVYNNVFVYNGYSDGTSLNLNWWVLHRGGTIVVANNVMPNISSGDYGDKAEINALINPLGYAFGANPCWGFGAQTITSVSIANPTVVTTSTPHGMTTGNFVRIYNTNSTPVIDGLRAVTVLNTTQYTVAVNVTSAGTTGLSNLVNYPAPRQIGYGRVTGTGNSAGTSSFFTTPPYQDSVTYVGDLEPSYYWGNSFTPVVSKTDYGWDGGILSCGTSSGDHLNNRDLVGDYYIAGRDYFNDGTAKTSYTPFTYPHPLRPDATQVSAPNFSPVAGTYGSAQSVTITSATGGATIRYTVDGSTPTSSSGTIYASPVSITTTTTLKAIAYNGVLTDSSVTTGVYTITGQVVAPAFNPVAGSYGGVQNVTITSATGGATIRYTVDGSTPTSSSGTVYSSPVAISVTTTLKAIAYNGVLTDSTVTTGLYTIITSGVDLTVAGTTTVTGTLVLPP